MQSWPNLWEAWSSSRRWKQRPADLYGITDDYLAWCFDRAVSAFGLMVEEDIRKATENCKTQDEGMAKANAVLEWWLKDEATKERDRSDPDLVMSNDWY